MKYRTTAALLALFLGGMFGVHKFYLGKIWQGVLYILFNWTFIPFIISIIDFFTLITMSDERFNMKYNNQFPIASIPKEKIIKEEDDILLKEVSIEEFEEMGKQRKQLEKIKRDYEKRKMEYDDDIDDDTPLSFDQIIHIIGSFEKDETKEQKKQQIIKQNSILKAHKCSIHNEPVKYGFELDGMNVQLSIINKCCEKSMEELMRKLQKQ